MSTSNKMLSELWASYPMKDKECNGKPVSYEVIGQSISVQLVHEGRKLVRWKRLAIGPYDQMMEYLKELKDTE